MTDRLHCLLPEHGCLHTVDGRCDCRCAGCSGIVQPAVPQLPPAAKPHPIDAALASLSEAAAELLASTKPSRFSELHQLSRVAIMVQRLRPAAGVDDVLLDEDDEDGPVLMARPRRRAVRFDDGVDLNTQIIMLAQDFLKKYADAELAKASAPKPPESRLNEVVEATHLVELRLRLMKEGEPVPEAITARIDHLLNRIGEPAHEPEPDPAVSADHVRRRPPDGAGEPDGGRVGEPLAERAGGDDGPG